jgi:hypothetical protein
MLIQLLPWWGVAYPQVPEISSVVHQLPCFEVGFSLCWFTRGLFLCLSPFLWGKVRDPSASFLLSVCYAGLLIVFQFCSVVWLWMLLTGSGDELCGLLSILLQAVAYHLPTVGPSAFLIFVYWKFMQRSAPCTSPLLLCVLRPPCPLCSMFFFSFLFIIQGFFFFLQGRGGSVCSGGYAGLYQGWLWEYHVPLICSSVGLLDVSQGGFKPESCSLGALLFSWCNTAQRSFVQAGGSWCWSFPIGAFFLPSVTPASQQDFWFTELTLSASVP